MIPTLPVPHALALLLGFAVLPSCSQSALSGPNPLGPDHVPVVVRGTTAEAHIDRQFHLDHYDKDEETPPVIKVAGANASATW